MRDQYAGDISDMVKFSLLRALAGDDRRLGVGWYYNPTHDGSNNGLHTDYLKDDNWSQLDVLTWQALQLVTAPNRSITTIEGLSFWPKNTCFHRTPVPQTTSRFQWVTEMEKSFDGCDLVFVDPDNGIGHTEKHVTLEEIKLLRKPNERALIIIKFPGRISYDKQSFDLHAALREGTGAERILTLRTSVMSPTSNGYVVPRAQWFTLIDYDPVLAERVCSFSNKINRLTPCRVKATLYPS